jgi:hypothetical protein
MKNLFFLFAILLISSSFSFEITDDTLSNEERYKKLSSDFDSLKVQFEKLKISLNESDIWGNGIYYKLGRGISIGGRFPFNAIVYPEFGLTLLKGPIRHSILLGMDELDYHPSRYSSSYRYEDDETVIEYNSSSDNDTFNYDYQTVKYIYLKYKIASPIFMNLMSISSHCGIGGITKMPRRKGADLQNVDHFSRAVLMMGLGIETWLSKKVSFYVEGSLVKMIAIENDKGIGLGSNDGSQFSLGVRYYWKHIAFKKKK